MRRGGFLERRWLIGVAVVLTVGEDVLLRAFGLSGATALSLQVAAAPPLGVFHDVRWLMVFHDSYATFAGLVVALFVFRAAVTTALVLLAWPDGTPRPRPVLVAANAIASTAVSLVVLTPAATLLFTMGFAPLFYFFLVALVVALPFVLLLPHSGFPCRWWRRLPPRRAVAWVALDGAVLTVASLALVEAPAWVTLLPAALAGLFDALCWYAIAHEVAGGERKPVALAPSALALLAGTVAAGAGFGITIWVRGTGTPPAASSRRGVPVVYAQGFRSSWDGQTPPPLPGLRARRFSYAGLGRGGPLPYGPRDTYASLAGSSRKLARQVRALHRRTARKVALLGVSEGTLVEKRYLLTHPGAPVSRLVMLSPVIEPGRVFYPAGGDGFGVATRFAVAREAQLIGLLFPISPATPLLRSLVDDAPLLRQGMLCAVPGVRQVAFLPLANAIALPPEITSEVPLRVVPTVHGSIGSAQLDAALLSLRSARPPRYPAWDAAARIIRGAAATWQVPTLPLGLNPAWSRKTPCAAGGS